jgi:hypothetical protein
MPLSFRAQLCAMHEMDGLRFNRYHELGQVRRHLHHLAVSAAPNSTRQRCMASNM